MNAVAPTPVRQEEFARTLGRVLSRLAVVPLPGAAVRTLFGEMGEATLWEGVKELVPSSPTSRLTPAWKLLLFPLKSDADIGNCMVDMKERGIRMRSTWRLVGFLLVLGMVLGARAEPPSYRLPGRELDSKEPWDAFLGRAAHFAIGRQYRVQHPTNIVFLDTVNLSTIVKDGELGDPERLPEFVRRLRPDITDVRALVLFEIKPDNTMMRGSKKAENRRGATWRL
ncbi:hypothetical protein [Cystobacter fuscus]|uniref:hypothetical protein n=1 Tax=Cystobacter fuscus TaxID=43 RepID=UPI0037C0A179